MSVAGQGLKPWREVLPPHDDVATGNFSASEFAADLHMVAFGGDDGTAGPSTRDPVQFFRRTYLTEGLRDLLDRAVRRMTGDTNASPVINLQTNFGGGKTHSMLALWHLLSGHADRPVARRRCRTSSATACCRPRSTGSPWSATHLSPSGQHQAGRDARRTRCGVSWPGSSAALTAFATVAEADATRTNPGDRAARADRGPFALPDPDRRVGRLRPPARGGATTCRRDVRHPVHLRPVADRGGEVGPRRLAGHLDPGVARSGTGHPGRGIGHRGRRPERPGGAAAAAERGPPGGRPVAAGERPGVLRDRTTAAVPGTQLRRRWPTSRRWPGSSASSTSSTPGSSRARSPRTRSVRAADQGRLPDPPGAVRPAV